MISRTLVTVAMLATFVSGQQKFSPYYQEWLRRLNMKLESSQVKASSAALIVVDMQNDFVGEFSYTPEQIAAGASPCSTSLGGFSGACFGVAEGADTAVAIQNMLKAHSYGVVVASLDDHSPDHCSFFATAGGVDAPAPCVGLFDEDKCDSTSFHGCRGTIYENKLNAEGVIGPLPPHCVRGHLGTELYPVVHDALVHYQHEKYIGIKGLDLSTDSFGVISYTEKSWDIYQKAGMFATEDPSPSVMIRSMLTWEKNMKNSTGAASYASPLLNQYSQPPPFSTTGAAGSLIKTHVDELIVSKGSAIDAIIVTGLAADWCVLDTALNAKAQWPDKEVFYVLDAVRPSYLPMGPADMYLKKNAAPQLYEGGAWLHDPADVAALLKQAGVKVIMSSQIV